MAKANHHAKKKPKNPRVSSSDNLVYLWCIISYFSIAFLAKAGYSICRIRGFALNCALT